MYTAIAVSQWLKAVGVGLGSICCCPFPPATGGSPQATKSSFWQQEVRPVVTDGSKDPGQGTNNIAYASFGGWLCLEECTGKRMAA